MSSLDALTDQEFEVWLLAQSKESELEKQPITEEKNEKESIKEEEVKDMDTIARIKKLKPKKLLEKKEIHLLPNQEEHVKNLTKILDKLPFALDFSMLGAGKTYTSSFLALQRKYKHVIVVCPVSVLSKWKHMEETYHLPMRHTMGYQSLRSVSYRQPSHGLLYRRDFKDTVHVPHPYRVNETIETVVQKTEFTVTKEFKVMVEEGLLLIFDEIQNIKNISSQFLAAQALIKEITLAKGALIQASQKNESFTSQVLLLSGSPIDKVEQAVHIFRLLGIMNENRISQYNIQTGATDWRGMNEIHDFCRYMNPKLLEALPSKRYWETLNDYSYRMFQHVFKHECSSSMIAPKSEVKLVKRNAYYNIDKEGEEIIQRGLGQLRTAAQWDGSTVHFVGATTEAFASVTRSLQIIETGKIQLFVRLSKESLQANPKAKVVLAVNYSETVKDLFTELKEYSPLILTGSTSSNQRGIILEAFQNNESKYRLLICNQGVASTGIDLDDKEGSYPRIAFVSPNYSTITSYQLGHRFQRMDSKSDAYVNFVFAKRKGKAKDQCQDIIELRVLDALSRKSQVMKETTTAQVKAGIVFPGDHEEWLES
jgi:SNF2 family DNA or RNA helicase